MSRKIIGTEIAIIVANKLQANCRIAKKLQIRGKYEAKLVVLNVKYFSFLPRTSSLSQLDMSLDPDIFQPQSKFPHSYTSIQMISSNFDSDQEFYYSGNSYLKQDYST